MTNSDDPDEPVVPPVWAIAMMIPAIVACDWLWLTIMEYCHWGPYR